MNQTEKNKAFILKYYIAMYGVKKTDSLIRKYVSDQKLIDHIKYFDKIFPNCLLVTDEVIAENDKVFVKARMKGTHTGEVDGILPTYKEIEIPFAICYTVRDEKIVDFWTLSDQTEIFRQLGIDKENATI